jgi:hypothetical protein
MTHTPQLTRLLAMTLLGLGCATLSHADILWFDELGGSNPPGSFADLVQSYDEFLPTPQNVLTFADFGAGTKVTDQYADLYGVHFTNVAGGRYNSYSGVRAEAGSIAEHLTGYDGSYMPNGDRVYVKFDNHDPATPFSIAFDEPVASVGAFVGMGVQGDVHSLSIALYDAQDELLATNAVESQLWDSTSSQQNYESFFAARSGGANISRIEILNDATGNFANALIIDNLAFSRNAAREAVPEPAISLLLALGVVMFRRR